MEDGMPMLHSIGLPMQQQQTWSVLLLASLYWNSSSTSSSNQFLRLHPQAAFPCGCQQSNPPPEVVLQMQCTRCPVSLSTSIAEEILCATWGVFLTTVSNRVILVCPILPSSSPHPHTHKSWRKQDSSGAGFVKFEQDTGRTDRQ